MPCLLPKKFQRKLGFTLIELLIVIGVLGGLGAVVLTAIDFSNIVNRVRVIQGKLFHSRLYKNLSFFLSAEWTFNDSSNPGKDSSSYGYDGTLVGGVVWKDENECGLGFGGCIQSDGAAGNKITLPADVFSSLSQGTISAGVYLEGSAIQGMIFFVHGSSGTLLFEVESSKIHWAVFAGGWIPDGYGTKLLSNTQWHHVAVIVDNSGWKVYLDGQRDGGSTETNFFDDIGGSQTNVIAATDSSSSYGGRVLKGRLDEVTIYSQALTYYQIQQIYAQGLLRHHLALRY